VVKFEWGTKRTCGACGSRFYDLRKMQATCPECGVLCDFSVPVRGRRGRAAAESLKDAVLLNEVVLVDDMELVDDMVEDLEEADTLLEDDDLGEDLEDIPDVIDGEEER
jgi:uncharacterized protein (TIGR02300 family)